MPNKELYTDNIEIRQRLDALSSTNWEAEGGEIVGICNGYKTSIVDWVYEQEDADFIAHAPDDMRRLLDRGDYFKTILNIAMNILISLNYSELPENMSHKIYKNVCLMEELLLELKEKFENETSK